MKLDLSILKDVLFILLVVFCLLLFVSCFVYAGSALKWMHDTNFYLFGYLAYATPFFLLALTLYCLLARKNVMFLLRLAAIGFSVTAIAGILSILHLSGYDLLYGGGELGNRITGLTMKSFGIIGSYLLMAALLIISLLLFFGHSFLESLNARSKEALTIAESRKKIYQGEKEIRAGRRRLKKEQKVTRRLQEQKQTLARLEMQTNEEVSNREKLKDIIGYRIEDDGQKNVKESLKKAAGAVSRRLTANAAEAEDIPAVKEREPETVIQSEFTSPAFDAEAVAKLAEKAVSASGAHMAVPPENEDHEDVIEINPAIKKPAKKKMSNLDKDQDAEPRTKTVMTSTGKIISVELDGLPGEGKRPRELPKKKDREEIVINVEEDKKKNYVFTPTDLLSFGSGPKSSKEELARGLTETAQKLQDTLREFGVGVTVTDISRGPTVTRYELQPEHGVKVSRIVSLADDIKLNLAAEDIRIEAPIPGKAAIGIEVPNHEKMTVPFRELIESDEFKNSSSRTVVAVGKDIAGRTVIADIEKMPHLLIAGATGSGKSVCINTIILSIIYKATPSDVKLLMIDPKVVELSVYNGIPHLLIPVVTDPKKAAGALNWVVNEMEERYKKFSKLKTRNISGYNAAVENLPEEERADKQKMPQIVVIVDELADLIMAAAGDVEDSIQRLAQKARAAGIHLILATQRPSVNVITGVIKANIPSRIAFAVSSGVDSRTILDMNGAEKLLGKGDMLFYPYYMTKPIRVQGAFVTDEEVANIAAFLQKQDNVEGGEMNTSIDLSAAAPGKTGAGGRDELFLTAGEYVCHQEKATIGNLQRQLKIGFNRAARIMDQLYDAGVVSADEGTKARLVLMSPEQFSELAQELTE